MKRFISFPVVFLSLACVLSSCGHDEENPAADNISVSESATESAETVTEEETAEFSETDETLVFVGKWQGEKFITDGEESDLFLNIPVCEACRIELCADDSVVFYGTAELAEPEIKWNWSRLSSAAEIEIFDSDNYENRSVLTFDGEHLIVYDEYSDEQLYLVKVDEFTSSDYDNNVAESENTDTSAFLGKWEHEKFLIDSGEEVYTVHEIPVYTMYQYELR